MQLQPDDLCVPPSVVWPSTKQQRSTLLTVPWAYYPRCMSIFLCVAVCACSSSCWATDEEVEEGSEWVARDLVWSQFYKGTGEWAAQKEERKTKKKVLGKEKQLLEMWGSSGGINQAFSCLFNTENDGLRNKVKAHKQSWSLVASMLMLIYTAATNQQVWKRFFFLIEKHNPAQKCILAQRYI